MLNIEGHCKLGLGNSNSSAGSLRSGWWKPTSLLEIVSLSKLTIIFFNSDKAVLGPELYSGKDLFHTDYDL